VGSGVVRAKPTLVLKAGVPAWGATGDPNAAIDTAEPLVLGPQFGGCGATPAEISVMFVAQAAVQQHEHGIHAVSRVPFRRSEAASNSRKDGGQQVQGVAAEDLLDGGGWEAAVAQQAG
jgi:urease subunit alpha